MPVDTEHLAPSHARRYLRGVSALLAATLALTAPVELAAAATEAQDRAALEKQLDSARVRLESRDEEEEAKVDPERLEDGRHPLP